MTVTKTMTLHHLGEQRYVGHSASGHQILLDNSPIKIGVSPSEALLAAVAGCTAYDVVEIMRKKRTPLAEYRVELVAELDDTTTPKHYRRMTVRHLGRGQGVTQETLLKAAELSHEKYCSVAASVKSEIVVEAALLPDPTTP
ncbi:OsmC family protein [Deinococcus ficus]|uniref:OsmC family protein n=1 Tax=Deinococcus ficus TaxID=317577 RepID=UPI0003B55A8B|nr:OsmC family protein [Deinococcus ficus]